MTDRTTEFKEYRGRDGWKPTPRHFSPLQLAKYMHDMGGGSVGKKYHTYGEVWDASDDKLKIGLLRLLIDEVRCVRDAVQDPGSSVRSLELHVDFMQSSSGFRNCVSLIKQHQREVTRLSKLIRVDIPSRDVHVLSVNSYSRYWGSDYDYYWGLLDRTREKIARCRSVRSVTDVTNLRGIGKKTAVKMSNND